MMYLVGIKWSLLCKVANLNTKKLRTHWENNAQQFGTWWQHVGDHMEHIGKTKFHKIHPSPFSKENKLDPWVHASSHQYWLPRIYMPTCVPHHFWPLG